MRQLVKFHGNLLQILPTYCSKQLRILLSNMRNKCVYFVRKYDYCSTIHSDNMMEQRTRATQGRSAGGGLGTSDLNDDRAQMTGENCCSPSEKSGLVSSVQNRRTMNRFEQVCLRI
jgi:hypothetical protein